jgi:hypothetical protein
MLMVLAMSSATAMAPTIQRGNFARNAPASPMPVTMPIRAHIICTHPMSGQVTNADQRNAVPNCAPAAEYVATPDGSSSAAPVVTPGPSARTTRRTPEVMLTPR